MVHKFITDLNPDSVFEFGSAWGKNGYEMMKYLPGLKYAGIDINETHVRQAEELGINVKIGDETVLRKIPDNSYDAVFTSSVLNHLPIATVIPIVAHLKRIAKSYVIASETSDYHRDRFFAHDYAKLGYQDTGRKAYSPVIDAYYHLYYIRNTAFS